MNGVVHVGAHKGEEVPDYIREGRAPIVCFEPQSLDFPFYVSMFRVALGCASGKQSLRVPHHLHSRVEMDTQSASLLVLIPERARHNGWTPTDVETQPVEVIRFDEWAPMNGFVKGSCDLLKIDVQGSELQVLLGFGDYLDGFKHIVVECSNPPLYEGSYSAVDVTSYLSSHGFERTSPILKHGDVHFWRQH